MFAAANTMFAAVANRSREIGALRAIGFTRGSIMFAFMRESILLCCIGGILGCVMVLPLTGLRAGTSNFCNVQRVNLWIPFWSSDHGQRLHARLYNGPAKWAFPGNSCGSNEDHDALRST